MSEKNENTGGSKDLKRGVPKTTDVAGPKKFKNKKGVTRKRFFPNAGRVKNGSWFWLYDSRP